jgi:hypothetical protein
MQTELYVLDQVYLPFKLGLAREHNFHCHREPKVCRSIDLEDSDD